MRLQGHKLIEAEPQLCYRLLTDPQVLVRTMPGLKKMEPLGDNKYTAEMEMGVAAIRGRYQGTMSIEDPVEGASYRLMMDGQGPGGFVSVNMQVKFEPQDQGTDVVYEGDAKVGGTVAGVGQRMLSGVANFIMNQFFTKVGQEAKKAQEG
ncbi:SRPBCC family protein [Sulfobacillus harzensis]|uniref:Carbon monoxide dehydrogenase subunit G n=1 Tax=Sulfobacillus harzensis TaxID=2729629 RepID=A0A7Y0L654_9FIRM|nr:carbon monoxide dehydrogenase subunit G [Sulfobacillus harzensis]NMP24029.1 carbon monoxide dehydrogenase subunit G [Sulfobacillus harzensis]